MREAESPVQGGGGGEGRWRGGAIEGSKDFAAEKPRGAELSRESTRRGLDEGIRAERRQGKAERKQGEEGKAG